MAKATRVTTDDGATLLVQGFRPGGGIDFPHVVYATLTDEGFMVDQIVTTTREARELGAALVAQADFAESPRTEENK